MRLHRFYIQPHTVELRHNFWLHDQGLLHQWRKVLRYQVGQELVLFDGIGRDRLYKIAELTEQEAHLEHVTDMSRNVPKKDLYLIWSLLKKDKNDWVLQKCTELGVSHFVPLLADRSEKTGFNIDRAKKIVIEAAEQCGRSDIPNVREPIHIQTVLDEFKDKLPLFVCEQGEQTEFDEQKEIGVLIGPEGGWSDSEKELFDSSSIAHINLHSFTLRAETACVAVATRLLI